MGSRTKAIERQRSGQGEDSEDSGRLDRALGEVSGAYAQASSELTGLSQQHRTHLAELQAKDDIPGALAELESMQKAIDGFEVPPVLAPMPNTQGAPSDVEAADPEAARAMGTKPESRDVAKRPYEA